MPGDNAISASIVDEHAVLSLEEMSRICAVEAQRITELVDEGILALREAQAGRWLFAATSVRRARLALRLHRDLEINLAGVALALDLMDDIEQLRRELRRRR
jgi:chaperone modulatory protein CbpM